jgi:hypothetical protein
MSGNKGVPASAERAEKLLSELDTSLYPTIDRDEINASVLSNAEK